MSRVTNKRIEKSIINKLIKQVNVRKKEEKESKNVGANRKQYSDGRFKINI